MTRKPTIGMLMAVPPAWSETFLQQTYHRLEEAGFQVVIFVLDKQGHTGKRLVEAYPRRFKRSIISASVSFLLTYLANRKRVAAYKKSLSVEGIHGREATKKIIQNLHILSADIDVLHAAFATQALGKECLGSAMGIPLTTSFRGFDVDVYPMKNPKAYDLLWKKLAGVHSISIYLVKKRMHWDCLLPFP
jgi:colanic acid/amylovoran biosynthesis glycosyltransferase